MQKLLNLHLLQFFIALNFLFGTPFPEKTDQNSCGKIPIQPPFLSSNLSSSFPFHRLILCRSKKLYFRSSIGLFLISSINYRSKTLIISPSPSSIHFISPSLLTAGFPTPPELVNSLYCYNPQKPTSKFSQKCSQKRDPKTSCIIFDDLGKLNTSFHSNDMKCSHYTRVYRSASETKFRSSYKLGTAISFDVPDHVPNLCDECAKPDGHCGVGLRCICHVLECKDKVFSKSGIIKPDGQVLVLLFTVVAMILLM